MRGRWLSLCALLVPLIFFAVVAAGIVSMLSGHMGLFRPGAVPAGQMPAKTR